MNLVRPPGPERLDPLIGSAKRALLDAQEDDGHWVFELEADCTIPAEYVLMRHFLGEADPDAVERRIGQYLRDQQADHGGWPLFHGGDLDVSASVKAYYALKFIGDNPEAPHMRRARWAILARGGAARANVFTRFTLALFGQVPWRAVPAMPIEIMLLPRSAPFHLSKVSYWSRTVIVPLLILTALRPRAANPLGVDIRELFAVPPDDERDYIVNPTGSKSGNLFLILDRLVRAAEPQLPKRSRQRAIDAAVAFIVERLNGEDGLGAIFPAMANTVMALHALGYATNHPHYAIARQAIEKLVTKRGEQTYCQPCLSPVWDTGLAALALMEAGESPDNRSITASLDWLCRCQITDIRGDWAERRPDLPPGGWAFQYENAHYPDVDDTAVVVMALHRADKDKYGGAIQRAVDWVIGMQSKNGGWGAFDADNTQDYLNHIPFADHGALLDPPTADVSARCISMLAQLGYRRSHPVVARGIRYLEEEQEEDGSWFGRWGTNYIYGTWSVLNALNAVGISHDSGPVRRAAEWLQICQHDDGGWGESETSYWPDRRGDYVDSTPSQTAWAVLGLMAAGDVESDAVKRGIAFLEQCPREGVRWKEDLFTAVGFPRVFYLKYHGYSAYFPLWALARYRRLMTGNRRVVDHGM